MKFKKLLLNEIRKMAAKLPEAALSGIHHHHQQLKMHSEEDFYYGTLQVPSSYLSYHFFGDDLDRLFQDDVRLPLQWSLRITIIILGHRTPLAILLVFSLNR